MYVWSCWGGCCCSLELTDCLIYWTNGSIGGKKSQLLFSQSVIIYCATFFPLESFFVSSGNLWSVKVCVFVLGQRTNFGLVLWPPESGFNMDLGSPPGGGGTKEGSSPPQTLAEFLDHFLKNHREDNFLSVKHGNYSVCPGEFTGDTVDWTMQYLQYM